MKKQLQIAMLVSLGLLSANVALANDAVIGALVGGGAGVIVGSSMGGRNGAIVGGALGAAAGAAISSDHRRHEGPAMAYSTGYYAPAPYYAEPVYYSRPVRYVAPPVYYFDRGYSREWRRDHDRAWDRRHGGDRHYDRDWRDHR